MDIASIPRIGTSIYVSASTPFDNVVASNILYTITSVRTLQEMVSNGEDVLNELYIPNALTEADYTADLTDNVAIVGLKSDIGIVYIPSNRMNISYNKDTVPYTSRLITVPLGALPADMDLTFLEDEIANIVKQYTGITSIPETTIVSAVTHIAKDEHVKFMDTLNAVKTNYKTTNIQLQEANVALDKANTVISHLQCFIQQYRCRDGYSLTATEGLSVFELMYAYPSIPNIPNNYKKYGNI